MSREYSLISPWKVFVGKRKTFILNINNYRNTHFRDLAKAKVNYHAAMFDQVQRVPVFQKIRAEFVIFPPTKKKIDTDNVCSIHNKFLLDVLVELNKIPDDDYRYHIGSTTSFGGIDKGTGHVKVKIIEVK